ncbi:EamA family transporter [Saccharospirillum impatiens]|uniref:EamA family transporter n=1 Tax=Saccharospirillum impatiens TaxID=169438 RepID=UPI00040447C3|nr:EamA family transporter [Saccharospirillum impatiens]
MRLNDLLLGIAVMCLWGFNFSVIKLGADQIDPTLLVALRFTLAAIPAVFFVARPAVPARYFFAYGLTFGTGVWGMMTWSITVGISAGMAGLLMQLSVVSSLVLGWAWLKERLTLPKLLGAGLALAGLAVSMTLQDGSVSLIGLLFVLVAAISWSLTGIIVKKAATAEVFAFSVWGMLFAPIPLIMVAWVSQGAEVFLTLPAQMNREVWFSVFFQAYPTTLLGYWLWNRLIVSYPLSTVAPLTLLVPVFGLLGSFLFYGEAMSSTKLLACMLILTGLMVSQWRTGLFTRLFGRLY